MGWPGEHFTDVALIGEESPNHAYVPALNLRIVAGIHKFEATTDTALKFATVQELEPLGVDPDLYKAFDYQATQAIAAAAQFLGFDGLIVPNARYSGMHAVLFLENLGAENLHLIESKKVDWQAWRQSR